MELISYSDFLSEIFNFWLPYNLSDDVMCLCHPRTNDETDISNREIYYIIPGNFHERISDDVIYDIIVTDDLFKHYLESGQITEVKLRQNAKEMYDNANRLILRCLGDKIIQHFYNYKKEDDNTFIYNILLKPWTTNDRKLAISPFEIPDMDLNDIRSKDRATDNIEDTYTKVEYITFDELKNRVNKFYNIKI